MHYVCPNCGAKIAPKQSNNASKIKGRCPKCGSYVEFEPAKDAVTPTSQQTKSDKKKKWNRVALVVFLILGGIIAWNLYDDYQRRESYREMQRTQQNYNPYGNPYQPSFTGNKYRCNVGGCLCETYRAKGVYITDCANCGHPKHPSKYD